MPATFRGRLQTAMILAITLVAITFTTVLAAPSQLSVAKGATARFNSLVQARQAGYGLPPEGPLHECIASLNNTGAMGFHYINGNLLDGVIDPAAPEALVYAPDKHGSLKLVALEYVVFADAWTSSEPPMLFDQMFMFTPSPNRYAIPAFWSLHAWIYQDNPTVPDGMFAPFNPNVSCG